MRPHETTRRAAARRATQRQVRAQRELDALAVPPLTDEALAFDEALHLHNEDVKEDQR